ncbi:unannotated protein [freshwater metagenome]|uniref:Unannotated protein n=1 Tax=freshwater metagenome TaxID=449393 RepID=A0A6J7KWF2_9ZZZZ
MTGRSVAASRRASGTERTLWSSLIPASQIGYQRPSASADTAAPGGWSSSRSRSLPGASSRRP